MSKTIRFVLISLFFSASVQAVQLLPFQGTVRPEVEDDFTLLQKTFISGKETEYNALNRLLFKAESSSNDLSDWANLLYVHLLLEQDSLVKAEQLLADPSNITIPWLKSYRLCLLGTLSSSKGQYILANTQFSKALNEAKEIAALKILIGQSSADNLRRKDDLDESLKQWIEVLAESEISKDSMAIADSYFGRGITRLSLGEFDLAKKDITISLRYFTRVKAIKRMANGFTALAHVGYAKGDYQNAIENGLLGFELSRKVNDVKGEAESLHNLALAYMGLENWNQALKYLDRAVQLKTQSSQQIQLAAVLNSIGTCRQKLGQPSEALKYFELALEKGKESGSIRDMIDSYGNISNHYAASSEFESAYHAQIRLSQLTDSLALNDKAQTINELEVSYNTEKKEQEILLLQQERVIITNRWLGLVLGLFLLIIIAILFIDNQKRKHRQEKELLSAEDELQKAELKIITDVLKFNQNKLSQYTENLLKKNELVNQLESKLRDSVDGTIENLDQGNQLISDFSTVRILTDDDWVEFKSLFDDVHKGLLERLLKYNPGLSLAEQRLFLLMKLDLSTKEIANILGVSPDSVKKGRYRLKRKIGIDDATSLQEFVTSF